MNQSTDNTLSSISTADAEAIFSAHDAIAKRTITLIKNLPTMTGQGWCAGDITVAGLIFSDVGRKAAVVKEAVLAGTRSIDNKLAATAQVDIISELIAFHARSVAQCSATAERLLSGEWSEFDIAHYYQFIAKQMDLAVKLQAANAHNASAGSFKLVNIYSPVSEVMAHVVGSPAEFKEKSSRYFGYIEEINEVLLAQPAGLNLPQETSLCFLTLALTIADQALAECKALESEVLFGL